MTRLSRLKEVLEETESVKEIGENAGTKIYSVADDRTIAKSELIEKRLGVEPVDLGERKTRNNGWAYARSRRTHLASEPDKLYANRFREAKHGDIDVIEIVTDYRAITEQASGEIYKELIVVYVIGRKSQGRGSRLEVLEKKTITAKEFVNEFINELDEDGMKKVAVAIAVDASADLGKKKLAL